MLPDRNALKEPSRLNQFLLESLNDDTYTAAPGWSIKWLNRYRLRHYLCLLGTISLFSLKYPQFWWLLVMSFLLDYLIDRERSSIRFEMMKPEVFRFLNSATQAREIYRLGKIHSTNPAEELVPYGERDISLNPAHEIRLRRIRSWKKTHRLHDKTVLDLGCLYGSVSEIFREDNDVFGMDINFPALQICRLRIGSRVVVGDLNHLPFKDESIDVVLFTEVLEHLDSPLAVIEQIVKKLKKGGMMLLTTESAHYIDPVRILNPLKLLEKTLGLVLPRLLAKSDIFPHLGTPHSYFHNVFHLQDMKHIEKQFQLQKVEFSSYNFCSGVDWTRLWFLKKVKEFLKYYMPLERIITRIPVLRILGKNWFITFRRV